MFNQMPPSSKCISGKNIAILNQYNSISLNKLFVGKNQEENEDINIPKQFALLYDKAAQLELQNKINEAYEIYMKLYKKFKKDHLKQLILLGIAYNFQLQGNFLDAETTYLKCSKYNNAQAFMKLGQLLIRQNQIQNGIDNLQKANCIRRFDKQIQKKLVYAYSLKPQTQQKALSLANSILQRDPLSLQIFQKQGKIQQAIDICLAINNHKESQFIKHYIGILYLSDSNVTEAFKYFKSALQINSNHVPSLIEIGTILSQIKPQQAIIILNKALQFQSDNRLALTRLAKIYQSIQQNHQKALETYRKTLKTKLNYEAYIKIGDCLQKNQSYVQALVNYVQALNLKKTHEVYIKIASIYQILKDYKKSIENYQLALQFIAQINQYDQKSTLKHFQQKRQIILNLSKNKLNLFQFESAINLLEDFISQNLQQHSKQIYCMLGQGYFGKGDYTMALQYYQKANDLVGNENQQDIEILENIALCFDKKQQYTASKLIYEKILSLDSSNTKCINNLSNVLLILGNTNQAFYWYEILLQHMPQNIDKRIKVADIYSAVGDLSKVQYHLLICYKKAEFNPKVIQKLISLYKEKRENKLVSKFQKKLQLLKSHP